MNRVVYCFLSIAFAVIVFLFPSKSFAAYTDESVYNIITGSFVGQQAAQTALDQLKQDTGWWGTYQPTRSSIPYYQIGSGGYFGEDNVKNIIAQFQQATGVNATYQPIGAPTPYKQVISGGYYGEDFVKQILQDFQAKTGLTGKYVPTGAAVNKKQIISGGYVGEDLAKQVLQQFETETGLTASYQSNGAYQQYNQVVSGGYTLDNAKTIMQNFISQTGIHATYVPCAYQDTYTVVSGGYVGEAFVQSIVNEIQTSLGITAKYVPTGTPNVYNIVIDSLYGDSLTKITNYFDSRHWWYSKTISGSKVPSYYNIVTDSNLDKGTSDQALNYFQSRGWWAAVQPGQKVYNVYNIVSAPLTDDAAANGLDFFNKRGLWATTQSSNQVYYPYYNIVIDPLLEDQKVQTALSYFSSRGWWAAAQPTSQTGYTYFWIKSDLILGADKANTALQYFTNNGWYAESKPTGASEPIYQILTGGFVGYDNTLNDVKFISDHYGWSSTTVKVYNGPNVTTTNYNLTLDSMLNLEMKQSPQEYNSNPVYVYSGYITNGQINRNGVMVRSGPGDNYALIDTLNTGFNGFTILGTSGVWTKISLPWIDAPASDVRTYLDPNSFPTNSPQYFQFLELSQSANINVDEVNQKILNSSAGILQGHAADFAQAGKLYNINELYLISHAIHETGNGTSTLANGVMYNGKMVYNMYGYGAYDSCPDTCGAQTAYQQGWFTPSLAIIGGAKLIDSGYINNTTFQQDTLYKMRWNPVTPYHQYATDIGWAANQVTRLSNFYQLLDNYTLYIDLPVYK